RAATCSSRVTNEGPIMEVQPGLSRIAMFALIALLAIGCGVFLSGTAGQPDRIAANVLVASYGLLGLGLGGAVLLALLFVTGARWSDALLPVLTRLTLLLPV